MGDTWGISGPDFLLGYAVVAVLVLVLALRTRRAIARNRSAEPVPGITARPHDVANLNGGPELAVVSALAALRLRGAVRSDRGMAQTVPGTDPGSDELERAVHASLRTPVHRRRIPAQPLVAGALLATLRRRPYR